MLDFLSLFLLRIVMWTMAPNSYYSFVDESNTYHAHALSYAANMCF